MNGTQAIFTVIGYVSSAILGFIGVKALSVSGSLSYSTAPPWWVPPLFAVPLLASALGLAGAFVSTWHRRVGGSLMITAAFIMTMLLVFSSGIYLWASSLERRFFLDEGLADSLLAFRLMTLSIVHSPLTLSLGLAGWGILKVRGGRGTWVLVALSIGFLFLGLFFMGPFVGFLASNQ